MSLRKKTILAIVINFFMVMAAGYIYIHTLFINGYLVLENHEIDANVHQFQYTLKNEIDYLGKLTNDWAAWDDTYLFIQNSNQEYINSNLNDDTYSELELNFIFYLDNNRNPVYIRAFDLDSAVEIPVENSIFSSIKNLLVASPITKAGEYHQGIFSNEGSPVIFAARPILTSLDEGPAMGTLVFGKVLNGVLVEHITSSVDSEVQILPYTLEKYDTLPQSEKNPDFRVDLSQPDKALFYSLIKDTDDAPIFIIEQILPRNIYQQGLLSGREFLLALILGCMIASILAIVALEYGFLRRFSKLIRGIAGFGTGGQNNKAMILKGRDEVSNLSIEMYNALTQLAETKNELTTHLDFEKLLVGISTKFISLPIENIDEGINRLLKVIGEYSNVERSYILLMRENDPDILDNTHEWCAKNIASLKESRQSINDKLSKWWIKTLQKGKPIIINDISAIPEEAKKERDFFTNQSVLSLILVPLIIGGKYIGLLGYDSILKKTEWSEQTILLLESIGTVISSAIDRNRHEKRILLNQINSSNLNDIIRNSIGKLTLKAACREISNRLDCLIGSDNAYLILSDGKKDLNVFSAGRKITLNEEKQKIFSAILQRSRSEIVRSENQDMTLFKKTLGESFLSIPLNAETANPGIIIFSFKTPHAFSSEEVDFCQQSASQISLIILKTKGLETARQKTEELSSLRATIADITSELELEKLLHTLLERAIKLMKADGGDFCMVDEETGGLKVVTSINIDKEYIGTQIPYGEGASGKVLASKKTLSIEDYSSWTGRLKILNESPLRSTVVLPLMKGDKVLGTLGIFHSIADQQFTSEDLHMLSLFAQHASIAMENALLFEKVQIMARIDELTGLFNRRAFKDMGDYEVNRAMRLLHPISLAMIDLDDFKQVNDQFGHQVGDEVLREIARICRGKLRNIDIMGRYGGDEMVILMPETDEENAYIAMDRLRKVIEDTPIKVRENITHITMSIGLTSYNENPPTLDGIMDQADSSLYAAKKDGKNCVRIFKNPIP